MKKVNRILEKTGQFDLIFSLSDRLKKIVSRSPIAAEIRLGLCKIILDENVDIFLVRKIAKKLY
jgi:hypothetical protein